MNIDQSVYWRYWGKASTGYQNTGWHRLVYHCLDVAACGRLLLELPGFGLESLARVSGQEVASLKSLQVFFQALHDLGKFARGFQNLVRLDDSSLVAHDPGYCYGGDMRHDTLGWLVWQSDVKKALADSPLPNPDSEGWGNWLRAVTGHHGEPPREMVNGNLPLLSLKPRYFHPDDGPAAARFAQDVARLLLPPDLPPPNKALRKAIKIHSWYLAGLTVLADWLGSQEQHFNYQNQPISLADYWRGYALPGAERALAASGLSAPPIRPYRDSRSLCPYLTEPTPLQSWADSVEVPLQPQLFILEDVTGAGKTEAALILAQRLMSAGQGRGLYFALPTMATSNQMYQRVGELYRHFFQAESRPNLVLAHGARQLSDAFAASLLPIDAGQNQYQPGESAAGAACAAWLGDSNKKALLADMGVGTLDQALLAIMPARHQSLRLVGLASKVLICDEIHGYDAYTGRLLGLLLEAHARQGGSAILLSATLPNSARAELEQAFLRGLGSEREVDTPTDPLPPYPLATQITANQTLPEPLATRAQVARTLPVKFLYSVDEVLALIASQAAAGQCVCWIRNSVDDVREAWRSLRQQPELNPERVMLFHSRYALADRLRLENQALEALGKHSTHDQRQGRVLVASQVMEQSVDCDADVMISDLAPIDLLIQRAGRLHRHVRDAQGNPAEEEGRPKPCLYILAPEFSDEPAADWYARLLRRAAYVYPDTGRLWLTHKVLKEEQAIVMPERARVLIEAVYGRDDEQDIPLALQDASYGQEGRRISERSLANLNALQINKGYCRDSGAWDAEERTPTRLGDDNREFILLRVTEQGLQPWCADHPHPWAASSVKVAGYQLERIAPDWEQAHSSALAQLREQHPALRHAQLLPLVAEADVWFAHGMTDKAKPVKVLYNPEQGLMTQGESE